MLPLYDDQPARRFPLFTILIIVANVAVFVAWQLKIGLEESVDQGGLVPSMFWNSAWVPGMAHVFSSMFMHAGWMHLIGNMWFMWIFGNNVEDAMGGLRFVLFYLACGVAAAYAFMWFSPASDVPLVGASGAISGILGSYLVLHPKARVFTLLPLGYLSRVIAVPAWVFLIFWIGMQILWQTLELSQSGGHAGGGGVAYLAHIGGFVAGIVLLFFFKENQPAEEPDRLA